MIAFANETRTPLYWIGGLPWIVIDSRGRLLFRNRENAILFYLIADNTVVFWLSLQFVFDDYPG